MRPWLVFLALCGACFGQTVATVSGRVTDSLTHQPVVGASVTFCCGRSAARVTTDASGAFLMKVQPDGTLSSVQIVKQGYARTPVFRKVDVHAGESVVQEYELTPAGEISGRLRDRDSGRPLAGFVAILSSRGGGTWHVTSRPDGSFRFEDITDGEYTLEIDSPAVERIFSGDEKPRATGYGRTWFPDVPRPEMAVPISLAVGEKREIEIKLAKRELPHISGEFEVPKGAEEDEIGIKLVAPGARFPVVEGQIEKAGRFRIEGLDPGSYTLVASTIPVGGVGHLYTTWTFEVTDHDIEDRKLAMQPGVSARARLHMEEDGAPAPAGVRFGLRPFAPGRTSQRGDEDPLFIPDFAPGEYWLNTIVPKGYAVVSASCNGQAVSFSTVDLEAPESTIDYVLTAQPGRFTGVVRDESQKPVAGAFVVLIPDSFRGDPRKFDQTAIRETQADPSGGFALGNLAPGKYRAVALGLADKDRNADITYLQGRMGGSEVIEIAKGQTVNRELTVR